MLWILVIGRTNSGFLAISCLVSIWIDLFKLIDLHKHLRDYMREFVKPSYSLYETSLTLFYLSL